MRTAIVTAGEGPTALLLHGLPTTRRLWERALPGLVAGGWRVVAPDLPGFGLSAPLADGHVQRFLDWLRALAARERPAVVVGQDYGGLLAALLAAEGGVGRVVLVSAPPSPGPWALLRHSARRPLNLPLYRAFAGRLYLRSAVAEAERAAFVAAMSGPPGLGRRMEAIARGLDPATLATLERLRAPGAAVAAGVWGSRDRVFPLPLVRGALSRLPGATLAVVPGARHGLPWDHPEAVVTAVGEAQAPPR